MENTNSGKIINEVEKLLPNLNYYKTNLVKCLPLNDKGKIRYPNNDEINICIKNLIYEINLLNPKIVFLLGSKVANSVNNYIKIKNINLNTKLINIKHPSYIYIYKRKEKTEYINNIINYVNTILEINDKN